MLDKEIEEKRYLQQIILTSSGFIKGSTEEVEEKVEDLKPIPSRFTSLSMMRKQAEVRSQKLAAKPAHELQLTEAERLFQENLNAEIHKVESH